MKIRAILGFDRAEWVEIEKEQAYLRCFACKGSYLDTPFDCSFSNHKRSELNHTPFMVAKLVLKSQQKGAADTRPSDG